MSTRFLVIKNTEFSGNTSNEFVEVSESLSDTGTTINISPENLLIGGLQVGDSKFKHWAEMYNDNNTLTTTISTSGVAVKVNSTSILGGARGFSHSDNRLTYTASTTGQTFEITATMSGEAQSGSQLAQFSIYKNGTDEITATITETEWTSTKESLSLTGTLEIGGGDYVELWVQNNTSNKNFEVQTWTVRIAQI